MTTDETDEERDVPDAYEAYATDADTDDPRFTDWLRDRAEPTWSAAVEHPFTDELGAGTLSEDAYAAYLVQDYAFVDELVGTFGHAVGQAPDMGSKRPLIEFLDTITDDEDDYFRRSFDALEVPDSEWTDPERTETTAAFVDLLGRAAHEGGYAETLAVLVPAEWIYEEWATTVATTDGDPESEPPSAGADLPFYYAEWIDLHAVAGFREFVDWLRGELDAVGPALSPRRQRRVERLFRRTVALEVAFFDEAYEHGTAENADASSSG
ncbi:transcriptional regulator [Halobiforma lacisalsi AJ5]|uniref:Transcriptional regulator n=1 Tax=Natronobacterium lacisalsi AJ5 TaxID=358396 RepID=M0L612_NATLA|nr:TenA family protein [Halobiforma lacisalsi]APW97978.1 transcriptional regulator [Halobiforma lacisalsi AJ5]EMA28533.1 transcriptional regulator [Halobiforma lacisalsi AJ5]